MAGRLGLWALFLVPLGYVGMISSVTLHEIVGHGWVAVLTGGEFTGFDIQFDGMGHAWTSGSGDRVAVLAGGIASEVLAGWLMVAAGLLVRGRPPLRATLALFALNLFLDGLPYGFWGAWFGGEKGDISRLLHYVDSPSLRPVLLVSLGVLYVASVAAASRQLFRAVTDDLGPLTTGWALLILGTWTIVEGLAFYTFDWEQLIDGAGLVPVWGALVLRGVISAWLLATRRRDHAPTRVSGRAFGIAIPCGFAVAGACVLAIALRLGEGIHWG